MNLPNAIGAGNEAAATAATAAFITRWQAATGSERANHQLFLTELCALLGVPQPDPARDDTRDNAYVFERRVQFAHGDGSASNGFIDCRRSWRRWRRWAARGRSEKAGRRGDGVMR